MQRIPNEVLARPVVGLNLFATGQAPPTLREQLGSGPALLAFLRHFG